MKYLVVALKGVTFTSNFREISKIISESEVVAITSCIIL